MCVRGEAQTRMLKRKAQEKRAKELGLDTKPAASTVDPRAEVPAKTS